MAAISFRPQNVHGKIITVTSHEWHEWYFKSPVTQLFVQQIVWAEVKENIKVLHCWPFVWWIHRSPVDSPYKGPVMQTHFYVMNPLLINGFPHKGPVMQTHFYVMNPLLISGDSPHKGPVMQTAFLYHKSTADQWGFPTQRASNADTFLCNESTANQWIPHTKGQ